MRRYRSSRKFLEDFRRDAEVYLQRKNNVKPKKDSSLVEDNSIEKDVENKNEISMMEILKPFIYAKMPFPNTVHRGTLYVLKSQVLDVLGGVRWEMNRPIDISHVRYLSRCFEEEISKGEKNLSFLAQLDFSYIVDKNELKVIDGQHRLEALREIRLKYRDYEFYVPVMIWEVKNDLDMMNLLHLINHKKAFDLNLIKYDEADLLREMELEMKNGGCRSIYGKRRPHMDKEHFLEKIVGKFEEWRLKYGEIENVVKRIKDLNMEMRGRKDRWGNSTEVLRKADKMGFYLGLDRDFVWMEKV